MSPSYIRSSQKAPTGHFGLIHNSTHQIFQFYLFYILDISLSYFYSLIAIWSITLLPFLLIREYLAQTKLSQPPPRSQFIFSSNDTSVLGIFGSSLWTQTWRWDTAKKEEDRTRSRAFKYLMFSYPHFTGQRMSPGQALHQRVRNYPFSSGTDVEGAHLVETELVGKGSGNLNKCYTTLYTERRFWCLPPLSSLIIPSTI